MPNLTKIAKNMHSFAYFCEGAERPAGHNRKIKHRLTPMGEKEIAKTLHGHEVAGLVRTYEGYTLWIDNCGWRTRTTGEAIQEFLEVTRLYQWVNADAKQLAIWTNRASERLEYETSVHIPLTEEFKPVLTYTDFRVIDNRLTYKLWSAAYGSRIMVGGYVLGAGVPEEGQRLTKGYCQFDTYSTAGKWVLRAKKPEEREKRLMTLVLKGEATIHAWEAEHGA